MKSTEDAQIARARASPHSVLGETPGRGWSSAIISRFSFIHPAQRNSLADSDGNPSVFLPASTSQLGAHTNVENLVPPQLLSPQAPGDPGSRGRHGLPGLIDRRCRSHGRRRWCSTPRSPAIRILTDPSYCRQIVTLTYPHIGNYGVNAGTSGRPKSMPPGLIIRDLPVLASNFRCPRLPSTCANAGHRWPSPTSTRRELTRQAAQLGAQNGASSPGVIRAVTGENSRRHRGCRRRRIPMAAGPGPGVVSHLRAPYDWLEPMDARIGLWRQTAPLSRGRL